MATRPKTAEYDVPLYDAAIDLVPNRQIDVQTELESAGELMRQRKARGRHRAYGTLLEQPSALEPSRKQRIANRRRQRQIANDPGRVQRMAAASRDKNTQRENELQEAFRTGGVFGEPGVTARGPGVMPVAALVGGDKKKREALLGVLGELGIAPEGQQLQGVDLGKLSAKQIQLLGEFGVLTKSQLAWWMKTKNINPADVGLSE